MQLNTVVNSQCPQFRACEAGNNFKVVKLQFLGSKQACNTWLDKAMTQHKI